MNSLFRGFINEKNIHDRYIYTIKFKIYILCIFSIIECLFSCNVIGLCFCDGMKDTSSFRLFSDDSSGRQIIRNFSFRQRLHLLFELLYGKLDERMRHEMKKLMLLSLRVQMYLLSSVEFLCFAWRNDAVWFLYLVLKSFSVSPTYVSVMLLSWRVTVAW